MTIVDYLAVFILVSSAIISVFRGFVREALSFGSWILALIVADLYGATFAQWLPQTLPGNLSRLIVAFVVLLIGVKLLAGLLIRVFTAAIKAGGLGGVDSFLGAVFGLGKGLIIILIGVLLCGLTRIPQQPLWQNAVLRPWAMVMVDAVKPYLPHELIDHLQF